MLGGLDFSNYFVQLAPPAGQTVMTYEGSEGRRAVFAYGNFITVAINFIILAFIIFVMVKQINRLKKEAAAGARRRPPEDVVLLREIRDALKK